MNPPAAIRRMTVEDLDAVMTIEKAVFSDPWSRRSYEFEIFGNSYSIPLVMEREGKIIGHAVVWSIFEEFHIATIAVTPELQGKGWGRYFLQSLLNMADRAEYALLEVRRNNTRAIGLYEKFGFYIINVRRRYYRNGEDALVMRKDLRKQDSKIAR